MRRAGLAAATRTKHDGYLPGLVGIWLGLNAAILRLRHRSRICKGNWWACSYEISAVCYLIGMRGQRMRENENTEQAKPKPLDEEPSPTSCCSRTFRWASGRGSMGAVKEGSCRDSGQRTTWRQTDTLRDGAIAPWRVSQARRPRASEQCTAAVGACGVEVDGGMGAADHQNESAA